MTDTSKLQIKDGKNVLRQKNGVEAFGVYVEGVEFNDAGRMARHIKMLLMKQGLVSFERHAGKKSARWRLTKTKDLAAAQKEADKFLQRYGRSTRTLVLRSEPLLVELTAADFTSLDQGDTPYSRYVGSFYIEGQLGKVDDEHTLEKLLSQLGDKAVAYSELHALSTTLPAGGTASKVGTMTPKPSAADIAAAATKYEASVAETTAVKHSIADDDDFDIEPF